MLILLVLLFLCCSVLFVGFLVIFRPKPKLAPPWLDEMSQFIAERDLERTREMLTKHTNDLL